MLTLYQTKLQFRKQLEQINKLNAHEYGENNINKEPENLDEQISSSSSSARLVFQQY